MTASCRDEVGELARAFNRMATQLGEVDRVRRELVANVSHELRTPITALQAVLENLVDGVEPADPETLRTMLRQVERLGALVTQLLDLSRLESGTVPLQRRSFELGPLLEDVAGETRLRDRRGGGGTGRPPPVLPPTETRPASTRSWPTCWTTPPPLAGRRDGGAAGDQGPGRRDHRGQR